MFGCYEDASRGRDGRCVGECVLICLRMLVMCRRALRSLVNVEGEGHDKDNKRLGERPVT